MKYIQLTILILLIFIFFPSEAKAATYYVTQGGDGNGAAGNNCTSDSKPIAWFNSYAQPGDTANICAGTITDTLIPARSGSPGRYITYRRDPAAAEWSVIIDTTGYGAYLNNKDYIKFYQLYFYDSGSNWIYTTASSDYGIVDSCKFYEAQAYSGILIEDSRYWQIQNSTFPDASLRNGTICAEASICTAAGTAGTVPNACCVGDGKGWDMACQAAWDAQTALPSDCDRETAPADFIRVEDSSGGGTISGNTMGRSSHNGIALQPLTGTVPNIIRGNTIVNRLHRAIANVYSLKALIENNVLSDCEIDRHLNPSFRDREGKIGNGIKTISPDNIIRYNSIYNCDVGFQFGVVDANQISQDNRFYHNTLYNNWIHVFLGGNCSTSFCAGYTGNILVNNIFWDDGNIQTHDLSKSIKAPYTQQILRNYSDKTESDYTHPAYTINTFKNNSWTPGKNTFYFKNTSSSPKSLTILESTYPVEWMTNNFTAQPNWKDPTSNDFTLTNNSTDMIDAGVWLTTITGVSGSGTQITVADPLFFYDGWGILGEVGDMIYTSTKQSARIKSIDYNTGVIQLDSSITWKQGDGVTVVNYSGSAPDMGAFEYSGSIPAYISGDLNKDGKVDIADYSMFIQDFGKTGANLPADLNNNGQVEIGDYSIFISNFGKTS